MTDQPRFNRARNGKRALYDAATVHAILDAGMVGHVGFIAEGRPMVMPMAYARGPGCIWLHGASKARIVKRADGAPMSMTVTLVDGIVAAR
jgi:nitroimidazol reductase NimA-like FMN-containing flavoprotein (pyridoxamine 5'-phosphate oxidase superfamily)